MRSPWVHHEFTTHAPSDPPIVPLPSCERRLKEHVAAPDSNPLLIFPEGTCVNNEYTVMFKKVRGGGGGGGR